LIADEERRRGEHAAIQAAASPMARDKTAQPSPDSCGRFLLSSFDSSKPSVSASLMQAARLEKGPILVEVPSALSRSQTHWRGEISMNFQFLIDASE
jgi:hypothetical protein